MSSKSGKLVISKILCRFGMLLVWVLAAANIAYYLQSILAAPTATNAALETETSSSLIDLLPLGQAVSADSMITLFGLTAPVVYINIGMSVLFAIFATALLAMAIAMIDLRNFQARRNR